jgi:hypothetical protein
LTKSVQSWNGLDATKEITPSIEYFLFFGDIVRADRLHADRFFEARGSAMSIFLLEGLGHIVASELREKGVLQELTHVLVNSADPHRDMAGVLRDVPYRMICGGGHNR